jgi:outer membrane immunogenic protein
MKQLFRLTILFCACAGLPLGALAGPEASGKEMKQVAPAPLPECNWTGFYIGLHVGGQFGHAETVDLAEDPFNRTYQFNSIGPDPRPWGYDQSGVIAGGQVGYNYQWNWLVLGIEADGGYMNIEGSAAEPESVTRHRNGDTVGRSDSDFYATFRGRVGVALNQWLFYATGGGIAVNWDTSVRDDCNTDGCGFDRIDAHKQEFDWGWTVGGGIERMIGCHWSVKAEYLYYQLDDQNFSGVDDVYGFRYHFQAHDQGHIVRAGLNYKF